MIRVYKYGIRKATWASCWTSSHAIWSMQELQEDISNSEISDKNATRRHPEPEKLSEK